MNGYYQKGIKRSFSRNENDRMVFDEVTGLEWIDLNSSEYSDYSDWEGAKYICGLVKIEDYDDWRLPTRVELLSIVDYGNRNPSSDDVFEELSGEIYWTKDEMKDVDVFVNDFYISIFG